MKLKINDACSKIEFSNEQSKKIEALVGKISRIDAVSGGLVNYVYRIKGDKGTVYLKIRGERFSALPELRTDPKEIQYERKAIDIFSSEFPEVFPKLFAFYPEKSLMVLSDVMKDGNNLEGVLINGNFTSEQAYGLGQVIGKIHASFRSRDVPIRDDGEMVYYEKNMWYKLGYRGNYMDNIIAELRTYPKQLVLGDLSPKNIYVTSTGKITICDLETSHMGNTIFDVGFLAAHIILHNITNENKALEFASKFLCGYSYENNDSINNEMLNKVILAIILYRVDNPVIPYNHNLGYYECFALTHIAEHLITEKGLSLNEIIKKMSMGVKHANDYTGIEREIKVLNVDPSKISSILEALGAKKILDSITYIECFDFAEGKKLKSNIQIPDKFGLIINKLKDISDGKPLLQHDAYLRIRTEGERSELILKIRLNKDTNVKEEDETSIAINKKDFKSVRKMLKELGFSRIAIQEKKRVSYVYSRLGDNPFSVIKCSAICVSAKHS